MRLYTNKLARTETDSESTPFGRTELVFRMISPRMSSPSSVPVSSIGYRESNLWYIDGELLGIDVGRLERVGAIETVGCMEGSLLGCSEGCFESVGRNDTVGLSDGFADGEPLGMSVGSTEGVCEGETDKEGLCETVGETDGRTDGMALGSIEGESVGS